MLTPLFEKLTQLVSEEIFRIKRKDEQEGHNQIDESPQDPWDNIEERYPIGTKHIAMVSHIARSCVIVELEKGVTGLIRIRDLSWGKITNPIDIVQEGDSIEVIVLEINREKKVVLLGQKQLTPSPWESRVKTLKVGDHIKGRVIQIAKFGAFVKLLPGVVGLIQISEMIKKQVIYSNCLHIGDDVETEILDIKPDTHKIYLSINSTNDPWESLDKNLKVGDHIKGKVVQIVKFGAFTEISPGVIGLIHISEMSYNKIRNSAQISLQVGDDVEVVIASLDCEQKRMSLSLKQLKEDPWLHIFDKYPIGSKHKAVVRGFASFGIFVWLEDGVEGLIHVSELAWINKEIIPSKFIELGADIDVVVLEINEEKRYLSLGHKQLTENPWDSFETLYAPGSIHIGKIIKLSKKRGVITLNEVEVGYATAKQLVKKDGTMAQIGDELEFLVICVDKEKERINLSHKQTYSDSNSTHL